MSELPSVETLRSELIYDPTTGILKWKRGKQGRPGDLVAGYSANGYRRIHLSGRTYLAHRIAFAMHHGRDVVGEIDHIDGDGLNNSISNLREATRLQNSRNRSCWGVQRHPHRKKNPYAARIKYDGRLVHIGVFATEDAAREAYVKATKERFGEFSPATDRKGTPWGQVRSSLRRASLAVEIAPEIVERGKS